MDDRFFGVGEVTGDFVNDVVCVDVGSQDESYESSDVELLTDATRLAVNVSSGAFVGSRMPAPELLKRGLHEAEHCCSNGDI